MINNSHHTFHIPVMGLGFTIDTPLKTARYGISSVMSISEDNLIEQIREYYCKKYHRPFYPVHRSHPDHRALRITAYLNLVNSIIHDQHKEMISQDFTGSNDIDLYFRLLHDNSPLKVIYEKLMVTTDPDLRDSYSSFLKKNIRIGNADVNIMTKCDKANYDVFGNKLDYEFNDAAAALRGFVKSELNSSVVFSAGMNPRLFAYCETFDKFYPDENGALLKTIIVKVSDFRSADIQGKYLAKKGLWVSEFRIESGLNCGGHVFPTDGLLLGPILDEFKEKLQLLREEMYSIISETLIRKGKAGFPKVPAIRISVQGGVGTGEENDFLVRRYSVHSVGWGSPFLLVPDVTNVDQESLTLMANAEPADYFLSYASPLGVGFNNFRKSSSEKQRKERISKGRPGSPCYKEFLAFNTEFTKEPICTASRKYQHLKLKQIDTMELTAPMKEKQVSAVLEKDCLCEGLASSALITKNIKNPKKLTAVTLCPGPNLSYFSRIASFKEMVDHIYDRISLLNSLKRPHMFINELNMYIEHYTTRVKESGEEISVKQKAGIQSFRDNLLNGIDYYIDLLPEYTSLLIEKRRLVSEY